MSDKGILPTAEELIEDRNYLEGRVSDLEIQVESLDIEKYELLENINGLREYILELENALAEAHLTSVDESVPSP